MCRTGENITFRLTEFDIEGRRATRRVVVPPLEKALEMVCFEDQGELVIEGDIIVEEDTAGREVRFFRPYGYGVEDGHYLWRDGVIPYTIDERVSRIVTDGIEYWSSKTPLQFVRYSGENDFIVFAASDSNSRSYVGRKRGPQSVKIKRATTLGWVVHEIGHVIGLWHEHSRGDRDQHIRIHEENIRAGRKDQFRPTLNNARYLTDYDVNSIMHYPSDAFSNGNGPTITKIDGTELPVPTGLSDNDLISCRMLYPTLNW